MGHGEFRANDPQNDDWRQSPQQSERRVGLRAVPDGPFIGDIAGTEVNFTTQTTIEDAQK